jgi:FixJ family two-component response regulator
MLGNWRPIENDRRELSVQFHSEEGHVSDAPIVAIVEDDDAVRIAHASLIRSFGWQVRQYNSANDFLDSQQFADLTCIVSDVQMPGTTGIEMQRRLRDMGYALPIIFITGFPNDVIRAQALKDGAWSWLIKPVDTVELEQHLTAIRSSNAP